MAANAKRRSRRLNSEDSEELGLEGAKKPAKTAPPAPEGESSEEEEESGKSGGARFVRQVRATAAPKPKETPERAKKPSPVPPEDAGARGSGEPSPARDAPSDELDSAAPPPRKKFKIVVSRAKRGAAPPAPEDEGSEEESDKSGDVRPVRHAPVTAAPKPKDTPERAKKPSPVPPEDAGTRGSGEPSPARDAPSDELDSAAPPPRKKSKTPAKRGVAPVRKRAKRGATPPQEEGDPSLVTKPPVSDETGAVSLRRKLVASPGRKRSATSARKQGKRGATATPPQEEEEQAEEQQGDTEEEQQVEDNISEGEKKPAVERSWSQDDELKILTALVEHAKSHGGALPDSSDLMANLTFDKTDANADKLNNKIRKLRLRYHKLSLQGRPSDDLGRQMFDLSDALWGQGRQADDDVQVEATFVTRDREFPQLSSLYPYLAEEVKVYAEKHSSGNLIMEAFTTIGDHKARQLDAMCKKQRVGSFNLELGQANLTKAMLSALSIQIN